MQFHYNYNVWQIIRKISQRGEFFELIIIFVFFSSCDTEGKKCIKNSYNDLAYQWNSGLRKIKISPLKTARKSPYKSCPGSSRICPSYTSCCISDNGDWSCCPNPSLPQLKYGKWLPESTRLKLESYLSQTEKKHSSLEIFTAIDTTIFPSEL